MFSKTAEYALRATIFIAQKSSGEQKLGLVEVAESIGAPRSFTAKILQLLTKGDKVISSSRGPNGGFFLTPSAKKLSIYTILKVIGEDDIFKKCVLGLKTCSEIQPCPLHFEYAPIKQQLIRLFEVTTIQDLANDLVTGDSVLKILKQKKKD
jgi:Rrf2 family transcriptional regulator, iron-sulfur cluster assembly transcription factor